MKYGYARESAYEDNIQDQIEALKKYGVEEIYKDIEKIKNHSELTELLKKIHTGDTIVVLKLDRLGKSVKQLLKLIEDMRDKGVNFVSIKEKLDTTTRTGKYCYGVICAIAQMQRSVIKERTLDGLKSAREKGHIGGRTPIDESRFELVNDMYNSGKYSLKEITEASKRGKTTVYNYIRMKREIKFTEKQKNGKK